MEYRRLGASDLQVSSLGLGTMTFGHETDEAEAHRQLSTFVAHGGTFIDTADVYTRGASESIIGSWLAAERMRDQVVLATKARFAMSDDPHDRGAGRRHLMAAVDASLERLGVDHVDLYQVHGWDPDTPLDETLEALDTIVASGRALHVGWSNVTGWQLQRIVDRAEAGGWAPPITVQPQYNLLDRTIELEVMPAALATGLGILPWSPLGGGWLTGKYRSDVRPAGATRLGEDPARGVEAYDTRNVARTWEILEAVEDLANRREATMAQVAIAWVHARPGVSSVLLGARTEEQLLDTLGAVHLELTPGEQAALTEVSAPGIPAYPYGMIRSACEVPVWDELGTV